MIPAFINEILGAGGTLGNSISGGKDSEAMLFHVNGMRQEQQWQGTYFQIFADLGEIEWQGTLEWNYLLCREIGCPLVVVQRSHGGLLERWEQRYESLQIDGNDAPPFSDSANRFCTDHLKVQQIDKELRDLDTLAKTSTAAPFSDSSNRFCTAELKRDQIDVNLRSQDTSLVVCTVGIRAQESPARAKKPRWQVRTNITTKELCPPKEVAKQGAAALEQWAIQAWHRWQDLPIKRGKKPRLAITWNPIFDWDINQVWDACGTSAEEIEYRRALFREKRYFEAFNDTPVHWAYITGNTRLSCAMCVLASAGDIFNGAKFNRSTWSKIVDLEQRSGYGFRKDLALTNLAEKLALIPAQEIEEIYGTLRELDLIYLDGHWRYDGPELTRLMSLEPDQLKKEFYAA